MYNLNVPIHLANYNSTNVVDIIIIIEILKHIIFGNQV